MDKLKSTIIKINLTNYELGLQNPSLVSLLNDGWIIRSTVPVDDEGIPTLLVMLQYNEKHNNKLNKKNHIFYCLYVLIFINFLSLLINFV